jgi:alkylation response protein AidB-like acyl-CoA dehydrogenase
MASTDTDSITITAPGAHADRLLADVRGFVTSEVLPHVADWDRDDVLPAAAFARLMGLGLMGALVPARYGGPGLSVAELVPVWRTLSQGWISLTGAVNPSGLATTLLLAHGTEGQRERWLRPLAAGEIFAAFSITEPQAGSDLQRLQMHGAPNPDGGFTLHGSKRWVAGGESCDVVFMLAAVDGAQRPSCIVLPTRGRGSTGWSVTSIDKLGYRGVESAAYEFDGFTAAGAEILGGEAGLGHGAGQMLGALDVGRVNVACRALGILDRVAAVGATQALEREVGETVLADYTHTQLRIGELHARMLAAESLTQRAAAAVDAGTPDARQLASAAKVICSDLAVWAIDQIARLAASRSYGAEDELARLRRDAPQTQIGEGANDALVFALAREVLGVWKSDAVSPAWAPGRSDGASPG